MSRKYGISRGATGIITGASSGIGRALALMLARTYAARLVINARTEADLSETAALVKEAGGQAICIPGDIASRATSARLVQTCLTEFGSLDLLVNNAGLSRPGPLEKVLPDDWRGVFEANFFAPLYLIYDALPHFRERQAGKIVNVSSVCGKVAVPGTVCYCASKFALAGMSEGMAAELYSSGIDVITVCPGLVRTEFFRKNNNPVDVTAVAKQTNFRGWLMHNCLSISAEEAARDILRACEKGGSHEVVLTALGVFFERLQGICPPAAFALLRRLRADRA